MTVISEYSKSILVGACIGVFLTLIFAAGFFVRDQVVLQQDFAVNYPLLTEARAIVDNAYIRATPDFMTEQYSVIRGYLEGLHDRYTFFIEPAVAQSEGDVLAGTYGGIGVQTRRNETGDIELYPFIDSPAERAGIAGGNVLVAVNNTPVTIAQTIDQVDQLLRGEVIDNNGVSLTISDRAKGTSEFFVPFEVINIPSVVFRVLQDDTRIGYLQIMRFTNRTPDEVHQALVALDARDAVALIIDIRDNGGGLLAESVQVASEFVGAKLIVTQVDKSGRTEFKGEEGGLALEIPLAILVNEHTASAAEILAGAIRDYERGILVGRKTYGKGSVQQIYALSDGSSIHVTSAEWFTPANLSIDTIGIEPTISMIPDTNGRDVELGEAVRQLQAVMQQEGV